MFKEKKINNEISWRQNIGGMGEIFLKLENLSK